MKPYAISLAVGLVVGAFYSFIKVRSPAPPIVALVGLLGMVIGEQFMPVAMSALVNLFSRK
jgi:XapX domain-containing protein